MKLKDIIEIISDFNIYPAYYNKLAKEILGI